VTVPAIRVALNISKAYATNIRSGERVPHQRHWQVLARLVRIDSSESVVYSASAKPGLVS
jgi:hypothetical protein